MAERQPEYPRRPEDAPSLPDKVTAIHQALEKAKVPHAIGGALALAYYAEPRATIDVNINVFVHTDQWPVIRDTLAPLGVDVEVEREGAEPGRTGPHLVGPEPRRPLLLL